MSDSNSNCSLETENQSNPTCDREYMIASAVAIAVLLVVVILLIALTFCQALLIRKYHQRSSRTKRSAISVAVEHQNKAGGHLVSAEKVEKLAPVLEELKQTRRRSVSDDKDIKQFLPARNEDTDNIEVTEVKYVDNNSDPEYRDSTTCGNDFIRADGNHSLGPPKTRDKEIQYKSRDVSTDEYLDVPSGLKFGFDNEQDGHCNLVHFAEKAPSMSEQTSLNYEDTNEPAPKNNLTYANPQTDDLSLSFAAALSNLAGEKKTQTSTFEELLDPCEDESDLTGGYTNSNAVFDDIFYREGNDTEVSMEASVSELSTNIKLDKATLTVDTKEDGMELGAPRANEKTKNKKSID